MKIQNINLQITSNEEGEKEIKVEKNTELPIKTSEMNYEKYDYLRSLGWNDSEIKKMIENKKTNARLSDSGYVCI